MSAKIGIAELKSRLSFYLRRVKRGRSITIYDRDTPIAQIIPFGGTGPLVVRERLPDAQRPGDYEAPAGLLSDFDIGAMLDEERSDR